MSEKDLDTLQNELIEVKRRLGNILRLMQTYKGKAEFLKSVEAPLKGLEKKYKSEIQEILDRRMGIE
jgi:hypothetical protein